MCSLTCKWNGLRDDVDLQRDLVGRRGDHLCHLLPLCRLHEEQVDTLFCLKHLPPQDHFRDQNGLETTIETKMSHLFMRSRWAAYSTWAISLDVPPIVAGTCHPWAIHRTQNKHTSRKYLCSSFLVLWFVIAMKDEIFLKTKIFFIAPTWLNPVAAPWTETSTDSLSTKWKSTREVFTTTLILCSKAVY